MNVTCPNCATVYRVDPAKVPDGGVRARCSICSAVFAVRRDNEPHERPTPVTAAAGSPAAPPGPAPAQAPSGATPSAAPPAWNAPAAPAAAAPARAEPVRPSMSPAAAPASAPPPSAQTAPPPRPASYPPPAVPVGSPRPAAPAVPSGPAAPPAPAMARPAAAATPPATPPAPPPPAAPARPAPAPPQARPPAAPGARPVNPFLSQDPALKARRLARALISDMVVYHPAKRQEGLRDGNLKELFEDEIKKSWEEYGEQVGKDVAETTPYFREALNEILAGGRQIF